MELKQNNALIARSDNTTFNRTFMELKRSSVTQLWIFSPSFNRTFMELKPTTSSLLNSTEILLIVPLWN